MNILRSCVLYLGLIAGIGLHAPASHALVVSLGGLFNIVDGGAGDTDGAANGTIKFNQGGANFTIGGTLTEVIVPGIAARLTLTDFLTVGGAPGGAAAGALNISSSVFAAIGPPAFARMRLDGNYTNPLVPFVIGAADIDVTGFVNGLPPAAGSFLFGNINPAGALLAAAPVNFAGATPAVGVPVTTQLNAIVDWSLGGVGDTINLPNSLVLQVSGSAPEPSTLALLALGVACARVAKARARRPA